MAEWTTDKDQIKWTIDLISGLESSRAFRNPTRIMSRRCSLCKSAFDVKRVLSWLKSARHCSLQWTQLPPAASPAVHVEFENNIRIVKLRSVFGPILSIPFPYQCFQLETCYSNKGLWYLMSCFAPNMNQAVQNMTLNTDYNAVDASIKGFMVLTNNIIQ